MLSMQKRFTVTLEAVDYAALRALAYADEVQLAVKARALILEGIARAASSDDPSPAPQA
jgi:hypothetical protein